MKVRVLPFTLAISMTCASGRSMRENQPREGSPGGEDALHCVMAASVSLSMKTSSPAARPEAFDTLTELAPLTAFAVRLTERS